MAGRINTATVTKATGRKIDRFRVIEGKVKNSPKKLQEAIDTYKAIAAEIKSTSCKTEDEDYLLLIRSMAVSAKELTQTKRSKEAGNFLKWITEFIEKEWLKPNIARFATARFSLATTSSELRLIAKNIIKLSADLRSFYMAIGELQPFDYGIYSEDMKNIAQGIAALLSSGELLHQGKFPPTKQTKTAREFFVAARSRDIALSMIQIIDKIQIATLQQYVFIPADFKEDQLNQAYLQQIKAAEYIDEQDIEQVFSVVEKLCETTAILTDKKYDDTDQDLALNRNHCLYTTNKTLVEAMHHLANNQTLAESYLLKFARHYLANLHKTQNKSTLSEHIKTFELFCAGLTAFYETKDIQTAQNYFNDAQASTGTEPWECIDKMKLYVDKQLEVVTGTSTTSTSATGEKTTVATTRPVDAAKIDEFKTLEDLISNPSTPESERQAGLASYKTIASQVFSPEFCEATTSDQRFSKFITSIRTVSKKLRDEKQIADACSLLDWAVKTIEGTWLKPEIARFSLPLSGEPVMTGGSISIHFLSTIRDELYIKLKELDPSTYEMGYKISHRILTGMTTLFTHANHDKPILKCSTPQATMLAKGAFKEALSMAFDDTALNMIRVVEKFQTAIAEKPLIKKAEDLKDDQIDTAYSQHMLTVEYIDQQDLENIPALIVQIYESVNILTDKKWDTANENMNVTRYNLLLKTCRITTDSILLLTLEESETETNLKTYVLPLANAYLSLLKKMEAQRPDPGHPIATLEDFCKGLEEFFVTGNIQAAHDYFVAAQTKTTQSFNSIKNMETKAKKILSQIAAKTTQTDSNPNIPEELKNAEALDNFLETSNPKKAHRGQKNRVKGNVLTPPTPIPAATTLTLAPEKAPSAVVAAPIVTAVRIDATATTVSLPPIPTATNSSPPLKKETYTEKLRRLTAEYKEAQAQIDSLAANKTKNGASKIIATASIATPAPLSQQDKNFNHWMKESFIPNCKTMDSDSLLRELDRLFPHFRDEETFKKSRWLGTILKQLNQDKTSEPLTRLYLSMLITSMVSAINCSNVKENIAVLAKENPRKPSRDLIYTLDQVMKFSPAMCDHFGSGYQESPSFLSALCIVLTDYKARHQLSLPPYAGGAVTFAAAVQQGTTAKTTGTLVSAPSKTPSPP